MLRLSKIACMTLLFALSLQAGVVVVVDAPEKMNALVQHMSENIQQSLAQINEAENTKYQFDPAAYQPHITLAFITNKPLSLEELKQQSPELLTSLEAVAKKQDKILLAESLKNADIELWPGKFEVECNGAKKTNYLNVVIKLNDAQELKKIADALDTELQQNSLYLPRKFPFSAHVTIGRISEENNSSVAELVALLKTKLNEHKNTVDTTDDKQSSVISYFELKGHDGSAKAFPFNG